MIVIINSKLFPAQSDTYVKRKSDRYVSFVQLWLSVVIILDLFLYDIPAIDKRSTEA